MADELGKSFDGCGAAELPGLGENVGFVHEGVKRNAA